LLLFMRGVRCGEVKKNDNTHFRINTIGEWNSLEHFREGWFFGGIKMNLK
jgi:hypothetical protein